MKNKFNAVFLSIFFALSVSFLTVNPYKKVTATEPKKVVLGGQAIGVKIYTKGIHVLKISDVKTHEGIKYPAKEAGIKKGDYITHVDGVEISSQEQFSKEIQNKQKVTLSITRGDKVLTKILKPQKATDNVYRAGIWVRDSAAGIGTVTFYDSDTNRFAALGHGITDVDTQEILDAGKGVAENVNVTTVTKGKEGNPGEINGNFSGISVGNLVENTDTGAYFDALLPINSKTIEIGENSDVSEGKAIIYSTVEGSEPMPYEVEIKKVIRSSIFTPKGMLIEVTDPNLLEKTGGVICGMSGSPLVKDNKLIGAVTHVFVNNPKQGYAIFIDKMLEQTQ